MKAHFPLRRSRRQNAFAPLRLLGRDADRHRTRYLLALSFLATLFPAWRAARLDPVEALRYE